MDQEFITELFATFGSELKTKVRPGSRRIRPTLRPSMG
jgi:hypothetical protein